MRAEAVAAYADDDPAVGEDHVFQGDIFHSQRLMTPARGGAADWPVTAAIVMSHHCEWTKAKASFARGEDWPILWAPLHELETSFDAGEQGLIRGGRFRYFLHLPAVGPIDRELVVDLRLIQPVAASELRDAADEYYWASLDPPTLEALRAKLVEYVWRTLTI